MVEVIDKKTGCKMMMMRLCGIRYQDECYLVYCIRRDVESANVFVSRLIKGSSGYVISNEFLNGEKTVLDGVVKRLLNKDSKDNLIRDGYSFIDDVVMDSDLVFDIDKCYVSTVDRGLIKECLIYYGLVSEDILNRPVVEVREEKNKFSEGFIGSVVLIVMGVFILIFCLVVIFGFLF